ncbi:hypothetical protein C8Q79DRAFT_1111443 [Trametes meyenii]|nr:hypothetical protein C8Q79DRAFT_1111443 [Trametes meyenii]
MSSYSSTSLSGSSHYARTDSSSPYPSSPSTSPGTTPPSPLSLRPPSSPASLAPSSPRSYRSKGDRSQHPHETQRHGEASVGVDPSELIGKTLTRVRQSRVHPCLTLHFKDGASFQVRVVGYDPQFRGVPKKLESDSHILNPTSGSADVSLTVKHAAMITLQDKAFQVQAGRGRSDGARMTTGTRETRWTQKHAAFAIKFVEEAGWHCIWATLVEYDEKDAETCVFRNFADVYVDSLHVSSAVLSHVAPAQASVRASSRPRPASPPPQGSQSQKGQKSKRRAWKKKKPETPKARW